MKPQITELVGANQPLCSFAHHLVGKMIKSGLLNSSSSRYGPAQFTQHGCFEDDFLLSILTIRRLFLRWSILGFNIYSNISPQLVEKHIIQSSLALLSYHFKDKKTPIAWICMATKPCFQAEALCVTALGTRRRARSLWCSSIPVPGSFTNLPAVLATETSVECTDSNQSANIAFFRFFICCIFGVYGIDPIGLVLHSLPGLGLQRKAMVLHSLPGLGQPR